ncbi:MAG: hypothetical protein NNA31_09650 [Nitrospira sp.]|nr:hypothetical protein [Nitrospira sp.]MCP9470246.1 hypothetical protein [Nitrospira sp.]MCP9474349.1 hypothetical protein [Nitrospira sp.]
MPKQNAPESKRAPGAQQFVEQVPKALAGMAAFTLLAYLEGVIYTRSYLSEFGALWILDTVPMAVFFERSLLPLLLLLFFVLLAVRGLFDMDHTDPPRTRRRFKVSLTTMIYGPWCLLTLSVLDFALDVLGYKTQALVASAASALALVLLVASGIDYALVRWRRPDIRLDGLMWYPALAAVLIGLYVVPAQLGRNFGKFDKDPSLSTLSTIRLYHDVTEYRLLFSVGDRLYVFPARFAEDFPPIETVSASQVESIQHEHPTD